MSGKHLEKVARVVVFIEPRCTWGPIYGSSCKWVSYLVADDGYKYIIWVVWHDPGMVYKDVEVIWIFWRGRTDGETEVL